MNYMVVLRTAASIQDAQEPRRRGDVYKRQHHSSALHEPISPPVPRTSLIHHSGALHEPNSPLLCTPRA